MTDRPRLLCVDDEPELLSSIRLNLRKHYVVTVAGSGPEALALFDEVGGDDSPFDVVLSDMRMPQMNGAQLLTILRERFPDVPRLLLSGQSDLDAAIAAINDAKIFRFLTKPCAPEVLIESLDEALEQQRLRQVERELLDQTLNGTVSMLTDVLGLVSAGAYSRTMRVSETVRGICACLDRAVPWDLNLAAMLSQIGFVVLPDQPVGGPATGRDPQHARIAGDLLDNIHRLETVAYMVRHQVDETPISTEDEPANWSDLERNTEILRIAVHFDAFIADGLTRTAAHKSLSASPTPPPSFLLNALREFRPEEEPMIEVAITVERLVPRMQLTSDLLALNGAKLAGAGMALTWASIGRIRAFASTNGVAEPILVLTRQSSVAKATTR